ncbi:MAG: hypothetical protein KJO41_13050 [Bacteroidia bacterium]|nr:hypothetical protein [Bacteroidia bacterium]NNE15746.1 hypothetical protein [Saprospiraceae bacterium]
MKGFLKKTALIVFGALLLATLISYGSLYFLRKSSFYKPSFLVNAVKDSKFDYIILGASTGLTTLDTKTIDKLTNLKGINLSMDDTALASHYLMLQHFLAQGRTTKSVVLAPGISAFNATNEGISDNDYRFMMFVNEPWVYNYYKEQKGYEANVMQYSKYIPFAGVSYFNAELFYPSLLSAIQPNKRNRFDDSGNYTYPVIQNRKSKVSKIKPYIVEFKSQYFEKIKTLCGKMGVDLICYISPTEDMNVETSTSDYFFIINHSQLIRDPNLFYDKSHVNSIGREVTSEAFAQELIKIINK